MYIKSIKEFVKKILGKKKQFIYKGNRNQIEEFNGSIIKMFPAVFIVELDTGGLRAFSYTDLIINNLKIK